jgi:C4-type Zn-finger protein
VPEPTTIEGVLRALVEAMEAKEAAEPDLPEWESNDRLRAAEAHLLRLYRESRHDHPHRVAIDIEMAHSSVGPTAVEVA